MDAKTLKEELTDWTDIDFAARYLACCIGLMTVESITTKHVFWSNNPVGNALYKMLDELVTAGVLEKRDEPDFQYRWSSSVKESWK